MSLGSTLEALLRLARVALASLLLVGIPLADAMTCSAEDVAVEVEMTASGEQASDMANHTDRDTQSPLDAQHCVHGHCHHPVVGDRGDVEALPMLQAEMAAVVRDVTVPLQHIASGLERPPKA